MADLLLWAVGLRWVPGVGQANYVELALNFKAHASTALPVVPSSRPACRQSLHHATCADVMLWCCRTVFRSLTIYCISIDCISIVRVCAPRHNGHVESVQHSILPPFTDKCSPCAAGGRCSN